MGNSIFDWEDEEEKQELEPPAKAVEQPYYLQPPPSPLDAVEQPYNYPAPQPPVEPAQQPYSSWDDTQWDNPWKEPGSEQQYMDAPVEYVEYRSENPYETARRGGLAWSAGIVFFSSVAFMLIIGWVVDYLLQITPWGIVGGIILGSIIGFIQFFRISSQIFNPSKNESAMRPLMPHDDDDS